MKPLREEELQVGMPDTMNCRYFRPWKEDGKYSGVLVVRFFGTYPDGSAGKAQGRFIRTTTMLGLAEFQPSGLLLDFRDLEYRWGSTLFGVFQEVPRYMDDGEGLPFPVVVVSSQKSIGLTTLIGKPEDYTEFHFTDYDEAMRVLVEKVDAYVDDF